MEKQVAKIWSTECYVFGVDLMSGFYFVDQNIVTRYLNKSIIAPIIVFILPMTLLFVKFIFSPTKKSTGGGGILSAQRNKIYGLRFSL